MVVIDRVSVARRGLGGTCPRGAREGLLSRRRSRARRFGAERARGRRSRLLRSTFDRRFNCSRCGTAFPEPTPALFSANSPIGACPECEGFGRTVELDLEKVIPNPNLSLRQGLVAPWRTPAYREMRSG